MMKRLLAILLLALSSQVQAEQLPQYYPATSGYQETGTVDDLNRTKGTIVIGDMFYYLSEDFVFHSPRSQNESLDRLHKGDRIGFRSIRDDKGNQFVLEAWQLKD